MLFFVINTACAVWMVACTRRAWTSPRRDKTLVGIGVAAVVLNVVAAAVQLNAILHPVGI